MAQDSPLSLEALYNLQGRIALVTGGGTGIGLKIAEGLATNGAKVYITGRRLHVIEEAAGNFNKKGAKGSMHPAQMDVSNKESILYTAKVLEEREGKLHILVNNAGQVGPISEFWRSYLEHEQNALDAEAAGSIGRKIFDNESFEEWANAFSVNTSSIFFVTSAFIGLLTRGAADDMGVKASVINITSISAKMRLAQQHFAYNSCKAAASHLSRMLATEFILTGIPIRVNAIAPGAFESELTFDKIDTKDKLDFVGQGLMSNPAKRAGNEQEIAGTVIYLVTPAGAYANGIEITIDGGFLALNPSDST